MVGIVHTPLPGGDVHDRSGGRGDGPDRVVVGGDLPVTADETQGDLVGAGDPWHGEVDGAGRGGRPAVEGAERDAGRLPGQGDLDGDVGERGAGVGDVEGGGEAAAGGDDQAVELEHGQDRLPHLGELFDGGWLGAAFQVE